MMRERKALLVLLIACIFTLLSFGLLLFAPPEQNNTNHPSNNTVHNQINNCEANNIKEESSNNTVNPETEFQDIKSDLQDIKSDLESIKEDLKEVKSYSRSMYWRH